jgi:hypothetical protein
MVTFFFAFVTISFFAALAASVVETVASTRASAIA